MVQPLRSINTLRYRQSDNHCDLPSECHKKSHLYILLLLSYAFNSCRSQFFTKEREHLINFIELYGSLTSLQLTHKTYAYTAPLSQFHLSEAVQFPFCTNIFSYIHKSITKISSLTGIKATCFPLFSTLSGTNIVIFLYNVPERGYFFTSTNKNN